MIKLSILICSLESRRDYLNRLLASLLHQSNGIDIIVDCDNGEKTIGQKRNNLLKNAIGEYVCFIDDDDLVSYNYVSYILAGIEQGVDCCSLKGVITEDGSNPLIFEHSIKYNSYKTNPDSYPIRYERFPNHLNCIRSGIAKQFKFPEKNHGEDTDWATQIHKSGLLEREYYIEEPIYFYEYRSKK